MAIYKGEQRVSGSAGITVQDDGTDVTARNKINFEAPLTVEDDSTNQATKIGVDLTADDIPDLPTSKITSGEFDLVTRGSSSVDGTDAANDYVLTADGEGGVSWAPAQGSDGGIIETTGTWTVSPFNHYFVHATGLPGNNLAFSRATSINGIDSLHPVTFTKQSGSATATDLDETTGIFMRASASGGITVDTKWIYFANDGYNAFALLRLFDVENDDGIIKASVEVVQSRGGSSGFGNTIYLAHTDSDDPKQLSNQDYALIYDDFSFSSANYIKQGSVVYCYFSARLHKSDFDLLSHFAIDLSGIPFDPIYGSFEVSGQIDYSEFHSEVQSAPTISLNQTDNDENITFDTDGNYQSIQTNIPYGTFTERTIWASFRFLTNE